MKHVNICVGFVIRDIRDQVEIRLKHISLAFWLLSHNHFSCQFKIFPSKILRTLSQITLLLRVTDDDGSNCRYHNHVISFSIITYGMFLSWSKWWVQHVKRSLLTLLEHLRPLRFLWGFRCSVISFEYCCLTIEGPQSTI